MTASHIQGEFTPTGLDRDPTYEGGDLVEVWKQQNGKQKLMIN